MATPVMFMKLNPEMQNVSVEFRFNHRTMGELVKLRFQFTGGTLRLHGDEWQPQCDGGSLEKLVVA